MKTILKMCMFVTAVILTMALIGCQKQPLSGQSDRKLEKTLTEYGVFVPGLGEASQVGIDQMREIIELFEKDPDRTMEYENGDMRYCFEELRRAVKLYYSKDAPMD